MVDTNPRAAERQYRIDSWIEQHHDEIKAVDKRDSADEYVVRITPINPRASSLTVHLPRNYDRFDIGAGVATFLEEIPCPDSAVVISACNAIRSGRLREQLWEYRDKLFRCRSELMVGDRTWHENRYLSFLYPFHRLVGHLVVRTVVPEPW